MFSQHFLNHNFHIILNNNTWNLLPKNRYIYFKFVKYKVNKRWIIIYYIKWYFGFSLFWDIFALLNYSHNRGSESILNDSQLSQNLAYKLKIECLIQ